MSPNPNFGDHIVCDSHTDLIFYNLQSWIFRSDFEQSWMYIFSCLGHTCRSLQRSEGKILLIAIFEREGFNDRIYVQVHTHCDIVIIYIPGLHKLWQPCSRAARKWRENEEMKRKWRENEEMEREIHSQDFLILCLFPPSLSISYIKNCHILSQNVKYGTFVANVTKNLTYAL